MRALSVFDAAKERPDAIAIVTRDGTVTFGELARRVSAVARWLETHGDARAGIAVVATLRLDTLLVMYAAIELGVPIFPLHPRLVAHERAELASMCDVPLLDEGWSAPDGGDGEPYVRARSVADEAPLAVLFTSGSTGVPKGVVLSHRAFAASAAASASNLGWRDDDRWLLCMPLAHVGGLSVVTRCLAARRPVVVAPWTGDIGGLLADVEATRVTILSLVPTMLRRVLDEAPPGRVFPDHVRVVLVGGDAASTALLDEAVARGVPVATTYGMTEACSQIATQRPGERSSGVGRPLPGVEVRIVDGEIFVRGPNLMSGYFPRDRWPSPIDPEGWLATRDLGHIDEHGCLHVHGRRSDTIITGGENVDPHEVERVLAQFGGLREARVFGVPDERWGQIVAAAIVPADRARPPDLADLARFVEAHLARHKRPRAVAICEELPMSRSGKVDRRGLAESLGSAVVPLRVEAAASSAE